MKLIDAFQKSHSPVCLLSANDGVFLSVNQAFIKTFGYCSDQLIGLTPMQVGLWSDHEFRTKAWTLLRNEKRIVDLCAEVCCIDGKVQRHLLNAEYVEWDGTACLFLILHPQADDTVPSSANISDTFYRSLYLLV